MIAGTKFLPDFDAKTPTCQSSCRRSLVLKSTKLWSRLLIHLRCSLLWLHPSRNGERRSRTKCILFMPLLRHPQIPSILSLKSHFTTIAMSDSLERGTRHSGRCTVRPTCTTRAHQHKSHSKYMTDNMYIREQFHLPICQLGRRMTSWGKFLLTPCIIFFCTLFYILASSTCRPDSDKLLFIWKIWLVSSIATPL